MSRYIHEMPDASGSSGGTGGDEDIPHRTFPPFELTSLEDMRRDTMRPDDSKRPPAIEYEPEYITDLRSHIAERWGITDPAEQDEAIESFIRNTVETAVRTGRIAMNPHTSELSLDQSIEVD